MTERLLTCFTLLAMMATGTQAHTGLSDVSGVTHGFMHPVGGLDHLLVMIAVGLFAVTLGGRALWLVPASFLAMMAAGGVAGMYGASLPYVEIAIGLSVVVLGCVITFQWKMPVAAAMALAGFFAIFHGHAHGAEIPAAASGISYALGFLLATALLHGAGLGIGKLSGHRLAQAGGGAMALAGLGLLSGVL